MTAAALAAPASRAASTSAVPLPVRERLARSPHRPSGGLVGCGSLLLLVLGCSVWAVDADSASDVAGTISGVVAGMLRWRWQFAALVVLAAGTHFAASAVAARAASGLALPLPEIGLVQLAAAAANRVSAAGLGGSAVNVRYFIRRGLAPSTATGAVAALTVLGGVADLFVLTGIVVVGPWFGLSGTSGAFTRAWSLWAGVASTVSSSWALGGAAVFVAVAIIGLGGRTRRALAALGRLWEPTAILMRSPRRLATLLAASAATTLILAFAFVASVWMVPGATAHVGVAALIVSFMLGSAAGNAVPVPGGVGSTDAALVAVLVAARLPAAVGVVLAFRLLTFWLPPAAGLLAQRRLVALGAL